MKHIKSIPEFTMATLLGIVSVAFAEIPDPRKRKVSFSLRTTLMAMLAMFSMKFRSLRLFDQLRDNKVVLYNLQKLYGVNKIPSDSSTRELLDKVDPSLLESAYHHLHHHVEQHGGLELYRYLNDHILITIDGSGYFSSNTIHCPHCCIRTHRNGQVEYYHQLLTAAIVHPGLRQVLPLSPEFILRDDGNNKNDCEINALKRMLKKIRKLYPTLKIIVLLDGLYASGPTLKSLKEGDFRYIIVLKEKTHEALFEIVQENLRSGKIEEFEVQDKETVRGYRYLNGVPLNETHPDILVNYLDHWEITYDKEGNEKNNYSVFMDYGSPLGIRECA